MVWGNEKLFGVEEYLYFWVMGERKLFDLKRDDLSLRLSFGSDVVGDYAERGQLKNALLTKW